MGGSLNEEEVKYILQLASTLIPNFVPDTAVETGTYKGVSTRLLARFFKHVHTLELNMLLYSEAVVSGSDIKNITYHHGDSAKLLPDIVKAITGSTLYFIDAHGSGPDSSWNSVENVPLFTELNIILQNRDSSCPVIFIFDDVRLFDAFSDWKGITVESIKSRIPNIVSDFVKDDRYYVIAK